MYLTHLEVTNIKRFKRLRLDLTHEVPGVDGQPGRRAPRMWTVLIGENGTCKTTLLQCVALTALGSGDLRLLDNTVNPLFPRREAEGVEPGKIVSRFQVAAEALDALLVERAIGEGPERYTPPPEAPQGEGQMAVTLHIQTDRRDARLRERSAYARWDSAARDLNGGRQATAMNVLAQARNRRPEPPGYFVAAYGVSREMPDPDMEFNPPDPVSRLRPLFKSDARLMATRFADFFGRQSDEARGGYLDAMRHVLGEGDGALVPGLDSFDLDVRGERLTTRFHRHTFSHAGTPVPSISLPQGYQSVLTWLFDLVGQALAVPGAPTDPAKLRGLVLIDELDQHLHPALQVRLVPHLRRVLPKMQFIVTTHSPGLLSSFSPEEIVPLQWDELRGTVRVMDDSAWADPQMLTGSEILSTWFGRANGPLNPEGRDRRSLAGILATPEELLTDYLRDQVEPLMRQLTAKLGPPPRWLSPVELERLAALRARRRG
ncbi:AAA family ATPase [Myxococcota bacterium]|nr:AAA family ATPase [Myxococcota bacterium]